MKRKSRSPGLFEQVVLGLALGFMAGRMIEWMDLQEKIQIHMEEIGESEIIETEYKVIANITESKPSTFVHKSKDTEIG